MSGSMSRLIYVDDSGDPKFGWIVYGWVECAPAEWRHALREWLELRKRLWRDYGVPPGQELHDTQYAQGRGKISKLCPERYIHEGVMYWKDLGRNVAAECLEVLKACPSIRIGAVARKTTAKGSDYEAERPRSTPGSSTGGTMSMLRTELSCSSAWMATDPPKAISRPTGPCRWTPVT
ncbi:hypothetical protein [Arthrobacter sp. efr-133-R2A-120]|uniref:hypothetical protein n=1 Tax=Arthrobacter sp. efr-133-R2A-120 TaxID=3040277 RepID=UPI00254F99C4|nr:hypothetical protein [Arthrobacter sp. efr-133-R2A-120]